MLEIDRFTQNLKRILCALGAWLGTGQTGSRSGPISVDPICPQPIRCHGSRRDCRLVVAGGWVSHVSPVSPVSELQHRAKLPTKTCWFKIVKTQQEEMIRCTKESALYVYGSVRRKLHMFVFLCLDFDRAPSLHHKKYVLAGPTLGNSQRT